MTELAPDGQAKTLAAVIAAVQAYMDEEERHPLPEGTQRLSTWKTAPWLMWRGTGGGRASSWTRGA